MLALLRKKNWGWLTNIWTVLYMAFLLLNFWSQNRYDFLTASLSALYIGVLSLYVGSKEFDRWYTNYNGKRHGELFVVVFTVLLFIMVFGSLIRGDHYILPPDVVAAYIAVLTIFIITQKSKSLHDRKARKTKA